MTIDRRDLLLALGVGGLAAACRDASPWPAAPGQPPSGPAGSVGAEPDPAALHAALMQAPPGPPLQVAMVLYPQMTALDLVGPQLFLAALTGVEVHLVAADRAPVLSDTGLAIVPTATFAEAPAQLDVLFVPGGSLGTAQAMAPGPVRAFVADRGARATWVTSVCTGALVLGAAGLLRGYRATTHWVTHALLADVGATPIDERIVRDRNRITAAGVSAGLDLGLTLAELLRGRDFARALALNAEYAPAPPVVAGTPREAGPALTSILREMYGPVVAAMRTAAATPG